MKHTPAQWKAKNKNGNFLGDKTKWEANYDGKPKQGVTTTLPVMAGAKTIALVVGEGWDDSEVSANAILIATAPELLEACKLARRQMIRATTILGIHDTAEEGSIIQILTDLINKAEGK